MYAASHCGVYADGITLSLRQAELARERIHSAGLENRCAVRLCDYRDVEESESYDKIASIGMCEHVGESTLKHYFEKVFRLLRPGGMFLNSGIAASATYRREGPSFIDKYVFSGWGAGSTVYDDPTSGDERIRSARHSSLTRALCFDSGQMGSAS